MKTELEELLNPPAGRTMSAEMYHAFILKHGPALVEALDKLAAAEKRIEALREALEIARKRILYLGYVAGDRHTDSNCNDYLPIIEAALEADNKAGGCDE